MNFHERCSCGFVWLLFSLILPGEIQASRSAFEGLQILDIQHRSLSTRPVVSEREFAQLFGLRVGDVYSTKRIRRAVDRLHRARPLRDVLVDVESRNAALSGEIGVLLKVLTVAKARVIHIVFEGNEGVSSDRLRDEVGIEIGSVFSEKIESRIVRKLTDVYRRAGYFRATVTTALRWKERGTEVSVTIRVDEGHRAVIGKVQFHGHLVLAEARLHDSLHAHIGEPYDEDTIRQDVRGLRALYHAEGYFDVTIGLPDIQYDEQARTVSIRIWIHAGTRLQVTLEGNRSFSDSVLEAQLTFGSKRIVDEESLETNRERLMAFYRNAGYPFVSVRAYYEELGSSGITEVRIVVDEGVPVSIGDVSITGNHSFPTRVLQGVTQSYVKGWFVQRPLKEDALEKDRQAIEDFYRENGFFSVKVSHEVHYSQDTTPTHAHVHLAIEEGVQSIVVDLTVEGNVTIPSHVLLQQLAIRLGMPMTPTLVEDGRVALLESYQTRGYPFAAIEVETHQKYSDRGVAIHYRVQESIPVTVGKLTLEGNDTTADHVIVRELRIRPGDPLNPQAITESQDRANRLDFIDDVKITIERPNTLEDTKDLTVSVDERSGGTIEFGTGFGDVEGVRGFADVSHSNLFGSGRTLGVRAEISQIEQRYALRYREPWFLGQPLDAVATISYLTEERVATDLLSFDRLTIYEYRQPFGTAFGFESRLTKNITASLLYRYEIDDIFKVRDEIIVARRAAGLPDDTQKVTIASLMPSIIWDTRNDPFNPTQGAFHALSLKQSAAILGSEDQFYKFTGQSGWFIPIGDWVVLALQGRAGYTERFGDTSRVAIVERFFVGGRNTVRGYDQDTLGVTGQTVVDGIPTGGNAMFISNLEFRVALPRSVGLVVFFDGGNVWRDARNIDFQDAKFSVGPGIRYNTPVGPLRLDLGYKLRRDTGESASQLHFTLGHAF